MSKNTEIELKLICTDPSVWEKIMLAKSLTDVALPGSATEKLLHAHYFDTPTYGLQREKIAYRIRLEGTQWVATVKGGGSSQGGLHERREWNIVVSDAEPDIRVFAGTEIGEQLMSVVGDQGLKPILITKFKRKTLDVSMPDGSQIEVAADQGEILAGSKAVPILELELELKAGKPSALFTLGAALAKKYPLLPETDSKFYRGLLLAGLVTKQPRESFMVPQAQGQRQAGQGLLRILIPLITEFFARQQDFFSNHSQPESVHELRIGLRRLRSILDFAKPATHQKYKDHQGELRKLGQSLRTLREIDVAYAGWKKWGECQPVDMVSKIGLGRTLSHRRVLEAEKLYGLLHNGYATPTLLELWATLTVDKGQVPDCYQLTMSEYAVERFSNWLRKVMRQGKDIAWADREKVRKLRLHIKKIKYAMEAFQPVLDGVEELSIQLEALQDHLGVLSDIYNTEIVLKNLVKEATSKVLQVEAGMLMGWQGHEALQVQGQVNHDWEKFYIVAQQWVETSKAST